MSTKFELKNLATGKSTQLAALTGTIGPEVVSIASLTKDLDVFTFDPGFMATASTDRRTICRKTRITACSGSWSRSTRRMRRGSSARAC